MQPIAYQIQSATERKVVIVKIARGLAKLDKVRFPKIYTLIRDGNTIKVALLEAIIEQMYTTEFDLEKSLLAIEENA